MGTSPPNQGFEMQIVRVISVDAVSKKAVVMTSLGLEREVRIDILPTRDQIPKEGEVWVIDQSLGFWRFVGIVNPPGPPSPEVAALQTALATTQASLATTQAALAALLAGPGVATTAARSDILTAAGALLLGQTYTQELWIPAKLFDAGLGSPTYNPSGSWAAFFYAWQLHHGAQEGIGAFRELPMDYDGGPILVDILYQGGGAGTFRVDGQGIGILPGTPGGDLATSGSAVGSLTIDSYNGFAISAAHFTIAATTAGAMLNMVIDRNGTHANDTSTNVMNFVAVRLRYTARRI